MKRSIFTLIALATATTANANQKGNGGDVFICPKTNEAFMLDYHETLDREIQIVGAHNMKVMNSQDEAKHNIDEFDVESYFNAFIDSLLGVDPQRYENYLNFAKPIFEDLRAYKKRGEPLKFTGSVVRFTTDVLTDADDSNETSTPENCEKHQLVIQMLSPYKEDRLLKIKSSLWAVMNNYQRAIMVLHETILNEAMIQHGQEDSRNTRYFNSYLFTYKFAGKTEEEYVNFLKIIKLPLFKDGMQVNVTEDSYTFFDSKNNQLTYFPAKISFNAYGNVSRIEAGYAINSHFSEYKYGMKSVDPQLNKILDTSYASQRYYNGIKIGPNGSAVIYAKGKWNIGTIVFPIDLEASGLELPLQTDEGTISLLYKSLNNEKPYGPQTPIEYTNNSQQHRLTFTTQAVQDIGCNAKGKCKNKRYTPYLLTYDFREKTWSIQKKGEAQKPCQPCQSPK